MINRLLAVLLCSGLLFGPLEGQDWPRPYTTPGTLGALIESAYSTMIVECGLPGIFHKKTRERDRRTALPTAVRAAFATRLNEKVLDQQVHGAAPLFAYVFSSEADARSLSMPDITRRLPISVTQDPVAMLAAGSSSIIHTQSCNSVIASTLEANAGIKVPQAHVNAVMLTDGGRSQRSLISLTNGLFRSPIALGLLDASASPADRLAAQLLVWRWYQDNPPVGSNKNWIISSYQGGALYKTTNASHNFSGNLELTAGGGILGLASVETTLKASMGLDVSTEVRAYGTFHYLQNDVPRIQVAELPTPEEIARSLQAVPRAVSDLQPPVSDLAPHIHTMELAGVPSDLCNDSFWSMERTGGGSGTLTLSRVEGSRLESGPGCRFTLELRLSAPPPAGQGQMDLTYDLVTRSVAGTRLRVPVSLLLNTDAGPTVNLLVPNPDPTVQNNELVWTIEYQLVDPLGRINMGIPAQLVDPVLTCASASQPINKSQPEWRVSDRVMVVRLRQPGAIRYDTASLGEECSLTGTLILSLNGGGSLSRTLAAAQIRHPRLAPISVPTHLESLTAEAGVQRLPATDNIIVSPF